MPVHDWAQNLLPNYVIDSKIEDKLFRAPYNYLKEKGIIDKVIELRARFVEIYDKDEQIPYGGNQMFFGDD